MGEFPFVDWLARSYQAKGESSGCWSDYLKAHGLANYCVARDPREERYRLVYEIEESWYKGKHPLTYSEHRHLTERHKHLLQDYRDRVREDFDSLKEDETNLKWDGLFSQNNMNLLLDFSKEVFACSEACSKGFVNVSREILSSSVDILRKGKRFIPCEFAVIALGSVAKGEATPYSDLEYAFIVESQDEYFTRLAVDSYFRIGNLGESPLDSFDIEELNSNDESLVCLLGSHWGFRIDGIKKWAGNIPTGLVGGQKLILTVAEFMKLYESSAESSFDGWAGKADMLSSSIPIYGSEGDNYSIYETVHKKIMEYEHSLSTAKVSVDRERLKAFERDINKYNFLPNQVFVKSVQNIAVKVKTHIFRYPTLLANNIRVCMAIRSHTPWDTFTHLRTAGFLSKENLHYILIVLALSIYIRTKAYIDLKTQVETISLYPSAVDDDELLYHLPQNVFLVLGYLLDPVKRSIRFTVQKCLRLLDEGVGIADLVGSLFKNIVVDKEDFMLQVELLYFVEDFSTALAILSRRFSNNIAAISCVKLTELIREKYQTIKSSNLELKYLAISGYVLEVNNKFASAVDFYSWLSTYEQQQVNLPYWQQRIAECEIRLHDYDTAKSRVNLAIRLHKKRLGLGNHEDILQHLRYQIEEHSIIPDWNIKVYLQVAMVYKSLGDIFMDKRQYLFDEATRSFNYALSICYLLLSILTATHNLEPYKVDLQSIDEYIESVDMQKCSPDTSMCLSYIALVYERLSSVFYTVSDLRQALDYATKSSNIENCLHGGNTNTSERASSLANRACIYRGLNELPESLDKHKEALSMRIALYRSDPNHPEIARCHYHMAGVYKEMKDFDRALDCYRTALAMRVAFHGADSDHPDISDIHNNTAIVHKLKGDTASALDCYLQALKMRMSFHGDNVPHSDIADSYNNVANAYSTMGKYNEALDYHKLALNMKKKVFRGNASHLDIAVSYNNIADVYKAMENYDAALDYHHKALDEKKAVFGSRADHLEIAASYSNIADIHECNDDYKTAVSYHVKSLEMNKVLPMSMKNIYSIANSCTRIATLYRAVSQYTNAYMYYNQTLMIAVNTKNMLMTSGLLCRLADTLIDDSRYKYALQLLQIAIHKAGSNRELLGTILHRMEKCCMHLQRWRKAWLYLHQSLSIYQSLPSCRPSVLARVYLSICQLLFHLGHMSHALEYSQLVYDLVSKQVEEEGSTAEYTELLKDAKLFSDCLQLVKVCQYRFCEFKLY